MPELPDFVPPMLAKLGQPFDSDEHLFEVKWDGIRALAFVDADGLRLVGRRRSVMTARYPDLAGIGALPPGTVVDGEVIVTVDGKPAFEAALRREQARDPRRVAMLRSMLPATYMAFDLLFQDYRRITARPLRERRERLQELAAGAPAGALVVSDGVVGPGRRFFAQAAEQGLEGIVAKRLNSAYLAGKRSDAWLKIKRRQRVHCLILGFEPDGADDFRSLILAADLDGALACVGKVGSGIDFAMHDKLRALLFARLRDTPLIPCPERGRWVEPGLYCTVSYLERSSRGTLRAPSFEGLVEE